MPATVQILRQIKKDQPSLTQEWTALEDLRYVYLIESIFEDDA